MIRASGRALCLLFSLPLVVFGQLACAKTAPEPFYKGKTIYIVVGYGPGGGYDLHSRLLSRYIRKHIPGNPTVVVQNMAGAGGVRAANHVYQIAPNDGTYIAAVNEQAAIFQLLGGKGVQYEASKLSWLGSMAHTNNTIYTSNVSGITSLSDAKGREVTLAGNGVVSAASTFGNILNALIGTKFKIINGYTGTSDSNLALERSEVDGGAGAYSSLLTSKPEWLKEKRVKIILQIGFKKEPDLPDVPLLLDVVSGDEAKQIATLLTLPTAIGYNHWVSPSVPEERLSILRSAYEAVLLDPELLSEAERLRFSIRPKDAAELTELVRNAAATPKSILDKTAKIVGW